MIVRAFEAFEASNEQDRLAARAAGQDGRGRPCPDVMGALAAGPPRYRARTTGYRHSACRRHWSSAFAGLWMYYASILHALRGELPDCARLCGTLSCLVGGARIPAMERIGARRSGISATFLDPSSAALAEIQGAMNEYRNAGYQLGITALYVLLSPALLSSRQREATLELIEQGLATTSRNSERIFEAELYRLKARALLFDDVPGAGTEAQSLFERALTTAKANTPRPLNFELQWTSAPYGSTGQTQGRAQSARAHLRRVRRGF